MKLKVLNQYKKILITTATNYELSPLKKLFNNKKKFQDKINYLVTGIGLLHTIYNLQKSIEDVKPDLVINSGICGALNSDIKSCSIIAPNKVVLIDNGYYYGKSNLCYNEVVKYQTLNPNNNKIIKNLYDNNNIIDVCCGSTNLPVFSKEKRIELSEKLKIDIVDMELFSTAYVCQKNNIDLFTVKSVSDTINDNIDDNNSSLKEFFKTVDIKKPINELKSFFEKSLFF